MPFTLQYMSDVHLEFLRCNKLPSFPVAAPYLALLGDIGHARKGRYCQFVRLCAERYERVFVLAGNHEYYQTARNKNFVKTVDDLQEIMRDVCASHRNVTFLDRTAVELPEHGIRLLGCTLWSHVPSEHVGAVWTSLNDYRYIYKGARGIAVTTDDTNAWHERDVAWLEEELEARPDVPTVVLTHHAPTFAMLGTKYPFGPVSHAFASDLLVERPLLRAPVTHWLSGYSHAAVRCVFDSGVVCASNCLGYPGEGVSGFDPAATITVETGAGVR